MNIRFLSIELQNFRSIDKAKINLANQGTVIVKGINEYEDKATSNGSGKSSIFEGIIYALFEETSSGEKDVENRIIGNGFTLLLEMEIDGNIYKIQRESKKGKASVILYKNDIDISARTKSDTNKMIIDILGISKSIFLDSVFLSQNATTNLASLAPTARRERLEILTNTDLMITLFKDKLKEKQIVYESLQNEAQLNENKLKGNIQALESQKETIQLKINEINEQIAKREALGNIDTINNEIEVREKNLEIFTYDLNQKEEEIKNKEIEIEDFRKLGEDNITKKDELNNQLIVEQQNYNKIQSSISNNVVIISNTEENISHFKSEIENIKNSDTCPTCGRKYDNINEEHIQITIHEIEDKINTQQDIIQSKNKINESLNVDLQNQQVKCDTIKADIAKIDIKINDHKQYIEEKNNLRRILLEDKQRIQNNINIVNQELSAYRLKKDQILSITIGNKDEFEKMIIELDNQINTLQDRVREQTDAYIENNNNIECIKHCIQLVTKEFRTYLLQNSLKYLNNMLLNYSKQLFSNDGDVIKIDNNDAKLDIYLGNATYESLSGGERTRVNIALLLAQKALASMIGNINCNLIILDEILGYCDSQAELNVIDLITQELESLESIYMVSHKEIPIGYDTELIVVKDKNGLSRIRNY